MRTLQVQNGDLQLDTGGRLQFITGSSKLIQDLRLWLQEEYGIGYTSPNFGSTLYKMIGQGLTAEAITSVQSEITRVLNLYQSNQALRLQKAQSKTELSYWNKSEIIKSINSINAHTYNASIIIDVSLTTLSNASLNLQLSITTNGIQVQ
jgi:phage baseplate assembly protein W